MYQNGKNRPQKNCTCIVLQCINERHCYPTNQEYENTTEITATIHYRRKKIYY